MSVAIATGGLFRTCCGVQGGGGGAVPTYRDEEPVRPFVLVKKVESKPLDTLDELNEKIKITLIEDN